MGSGFMSPVNPHCILHRLSVGPMILLPPCQCGAWNAQARPGGPVHILCPPPGSCQPPDAARQQEAPDLQSLPSQRVALLFLAAFSFHHLWVHVICMHIFRMGCFTYIPKSILRVFTGANVALGRT